MKKYIILLLTFSLFITGSEHTLQVALAAEKPRQLIPVYLDEREDSSIVYGNRGDDTIKAFVPLKHSTTFIRNEEDDWAINVNLRHLPLGLIQKNCGSMIDCELQVGDTYVNGVLQETNAITALTHNSKFRSRPDSIFLHQSEAHYSNNSYLFIPITIILENLNDGTPFLSRLQQIVELFLLKPEIRIDIFRKNFELAIEQEKIDYKDEKGRTDAQVALDTRNGIDIKTRCNMLEKVQLQHAKKHSSKIIKLLFNLNNSAPMDNSIIETLRNREIGKVRPQGNQFFPPKKTI